MVARFGGDEFVYLLPSLGSDLAHADETVLAVAQAIKTSLSTVFIVDDTHYNVGCSIGYDVYPMLSQNDVDIIKNADVAMYEAKKNKLKLCIKYSPSLMEKLTNRLSYSRDLKSAISNNEFIMHYQPQVNSSGQIIGAEALLRWDRPNYGAASPAEYIPIAEESDLIYKIGDWVLYSVFNDARRLYEKGLPTNFQHLAVNISGKQLNQDSFVEHFKKLLRLQNIPPSLISVEITENTLINNVDRAIDAIYQLRTMGVNCAIDDFGTGYSSLAYLKKLSASTIKLDRAFVSHIDSDGDNQSIARMVLALGQNFGMNVIAEGVERVEELHCLKDYGCKNYQGFYFYKPMPFEQLENLL